MLGPEDYLRWRRLRRSGRRTSRGWTWSTCSSVMLHERSSSSHYSRLRTMARPARADADVRVFESCASGMGHSGRVPFQREER